MEKSILLHIDLQVGNCRDLVHYHLFLIGFKPISNGLTESEVNAWHETTHQIYIIGSYARGERIICITRLYSARVFFNHGILAIRTRLVLRLSDIDHYFSFSKEIEVSKNAKLLILKI